MTTIYIPQRIEYAEQAEALPIGTVGHEPPHLYAYIKRARNRWQETGHDSHLADYEMVPFTAFVPIEAEEETMRRPSTPLGDVPRDTDLTRYVTEWKGAT